MFKIVAVPQEGVLDIGGLKTHELPMLDEPVLHSLINAKREAMNIADKEVNMMFIIPFQDANGNSVTNLWRMQATYTVLCRINEQLIRDDSELAIHGTAGILRAFTGPDSILSDIITREQLPIRFHVVTKDFMEALDKLHDAQQKYVSYTHTLINGDPAPIRIYGGDSVRFNKYGRLLLLDNDWINGELAAGKPFCYRNGENSGITLGQRYRKPYKVEVGRIVFRSRGTFDLEDYHKHTPEVLVPDKDSIIQIAPPVKRNGKKLLQEQEYFFLKQGVPVMIKPGVRHFAPDPVCPGLTTSPVIFRYQTTTQQKDFNKMHFPFRRMVI